MFGLKRSHLKPLGFAIKDGFGEYEITDRAAALTYYGFLSLFPMLLVGVALLALFGTFPDTYESIIGTLRDAAPGSAIDAIDSALQNVLQNRGSAASLLGIGLVTVFFSASGAMGAALRAIGNIHGVTDKPSFLRSLIERLGTTVTIMAILFVAFGSLIVAGPVFQSVADAAGLGESAKTLIALARWPIGLGALLAAILMLYSRGSEFAEDDWTIRDLVPGALVATVLWLIASVGFTFYVSNFGSYDATYGTLGAVIVLLVWMWIGNNAILAGSLINVERRKILAPGIGYGDEDVITTEDLG